MTLNDLHVTLAVCRLNLCVDIKGLVLLVAEVKVVLMHGRHVLPPGVTTVVEHVVD